jgi:hypothetical protein
MWNILYSIWNLWLMLSIFFGAVTIVMLILALVLNPLIWIGFPFTLIVTLIFIYMYLKPSPGQSGGSESSLDNY